MKKHIKSILIIYFLFSFTYLISQENRILLLHSQFDIEWEETRKIKMTCLIAKEIEDKQKIVEMRFSIPPDTIYEKDDNRYAEFLMEAEKKINKLEIRSLLEVCHHDLKKRKKDKKEKKIRKIKGF